MSTRSNTGVGMRSTKQRIAVIQALEHFDDFRSSQEIHNYLRREGATVGLTTVYRTLTALAESGDVDVIIGDDGESVYRFCSHTHQYLLTCRSCPKKTEVDGPAVERWASKVSDEHGFTEVSHSLEISGVCGDCSR